MAVTALRAPRMKPWVCSVGQKQSSWGCSSDVVFAVKWEAGGKGLEEVGAAAVENGS